jgi:hypothetical protein
MTRDIRERLALFARQDIEVRRLGLNIDQTAGLPPNPAKEADQRYAAYARQFGRDCWELDALSPQAGLVRTALERLRDERAWSSALSGETAARAVLIDAARNWTEVESFLRGRR